MRPICVVLPDEFRQHRCQVLLVEHDQVIEAFSTERPNDTFGDRIRTRRPNGCCDGIDADPPGSLAEVAAVDRISITQQMARPAGSGRRVDQLSPHPGSGRVGCHVHVHQHAPTVGDEHQHVQGLERSAGTVKRSAAQRWCA